MARTFPTPPQIELARERLVARMQEVEKRKIDAQSASWVEVERAVIKLLGGPYRPEDPEHQLIALGIAGLFGERLAQEHGAFWFPNREAIEGAVMGFPEAVVMLSPFGAVVESLGAARLERLDEVAREIRTAVGRVKFSATPQPPPARLTPLDYQRLFDPGFVQLVAIDGAKAKTVYEGTPAHLLREVRDGLARAGAKLPPEARQQLEGQLTTALQRLEQSRPLFHQLGRGPRLPELLVHLFGTVASTGCAPEELWQDLVFPLLHIGAPEKFPPLDQEEIAAYQQGMDPLLLFVEVVPYQTSAPEEGLMGAFAGEELSLPHEAFGKAGSLRLVKLSASRLRPLVAQFDEAKVRDAVGRFSAYLRAKAEKAPPAGAVAHLLDAALELLRDLKRVMSATGELHLRRITEAEAASEGALAAVREVVQGPRLILV
ncbi:MAG: hypothetical protein HYZ28_22345 [Myxococcales bacterium]|nr:hypothetical protein [Myxococcales bacterium]